MESKVAVKPEPVWLVEDKSVLAGMKSELEPKIFSDVKRDGTSSCEMILQEIVQHIKVEPDYISDLDEEESPNLISAEQDIDTAGNGDSSQNYAEVKKDASLCIDNLNTSNEGIKNEIDVEEHIVPDLSSEFSLIYKGSGDGSIQEGSTKSFSVQTNQPGFDSEEHTSLTEKKELICKTRNKDMNDLLDNEAHASEKPYKCEVCSMSFSLSSSLANHKKSHTREKSIKCEVCCKDFTRVAHLTRHMRSHTGDKPFQCEVCSKCFSWSSSLVEHMRTHTGDKPYKCEVCSKCFTQSGNLALHMSTHSGDKCYKCEKCNKCFVRSTYLTCHMKTHTGDRHYACGVCNKSYTRSSHLAAHMRTHTGIKPFKCEVCSKCFTHSGNFAQHKRTHTGDKPFKCDVCSKCFTLCSHLTRHMRTHTRD